MSHSSYWLENIEATEQSLGIDRLTRLSSIRRAIGNFVHILTRDNTIAVRFSSGQKSYTDGKTVTVSATVDPKKFDQMVGLALHEAAAAVLPGVEGDGWRWAPEGKGELLGVVEAKLLPGGTGGGLYSELERVCFAECERQALLEGVGVGVSESRMRM